MMFITPTPPTTSATAAMAETSAAMVWLDFITALRICSAASEASAALVGTLSRTRTVMLSRRWLPSSREAAEVYGT
ncbi:hypothetical protein G6F58_013326 [Rhizopus delemar]|nr:hypothetical protein G6F58_013326 [Rhizopus delemar]